MLDIRLLRDDPEGIAKRLKDRNPEIDISEIIALDRRRLELIREVEDLKAERNRGSQEVGQLKKEGKDASALLERLGELAERIDAYERELKEIEPRINDLLARLPNLPHPSVPVGKKEEKVVVRSFGARPEFDFPVKHHLEIGEEKGILDFRRAAMIAGARFPMYIGMGAVLEMALIQFMFMFHVRNGYTPVFPPFLANAESFYVSSQLPKFADQIYHCEKDDLYLNPTAESLLANLHRDEILSADELPKNYVAYTPCFRREAGTYGEEERGLIRVHQFNKVELFKYTTPETSYQELDALVQEAEGVLQALRIHYRVVILPTQDLAQQSSKTIDIEVYLPGQGRYYEVSSCSNCEEFQARRGKVRYRPSPKEKPRYVHTLNGSGVATSRLMAAILENNQLPDGRIKIPEVLQEAVGAEYL
ncbi:MAG TPA: serine--tRNA ligase [Candidatus Acetothermia bacterium]|nr:serine--tRNA ligase [Candidatus Acetothermia bacterium]